MKKDKEFRQKLSEKLENFEAQPQENTWEKIRFSVDLKQKMQDYEVNPDEKTWNDINIPLSLRRKFEDYEIEPKVETWKNIQAALQEKENRKIVVLPIIYKIGIAAGIILSVTGILQLFQTQEKPLAIRKPSRSVVLLPSEKNKENIFSDIKKIQDTSLPNSINKIEEKPRVERYTSIHTKQTIQTIDSIPSASQESPIVEKKSMAHENTIPTLDLMISKKIEPFIMHKPFSTVSFEKSESVASSKQRKKIIITSGIMPLQTYQAMTILPQSNTYIQQINNLNALDAQRLGIQARLGFLQPISKKFSSGVSLSYSGLQQVIDYETNSGNYQLQINDNQNYTLVGIGENVNQQKFLHSLGLKIDNALQISKKKNKVVLLGGGEAVRVLNDDRFSYYLNASIAFSYSNRNGKNVWIEPSYRYNLSQTPDINNYLQVRASNIGLNVRVNFM